MSTEDCEDEVGRAGGDGMSRADARQLLEDVDTRAQRLMRERGMSPQLAAIEAARQLGDEDAFASAVQRRRRLIDLQKRVARRRALDEAAADIGKRRGRGGPDLATALRNQIVAIVTPTKGGRLSAEAVMNARRAEYSAGIVRDLERAGLLRAARDGALERQWGRELWELSRQAAGRRAKPGVTGSAEALKIATILHGWQELAKSRINREGGFIGDYSGYVTRTVHDAGKIWKAGEAGWVAQVLPLLDPDRMDGVGPGELKRVWASLVTGTHLVDDKPMLVDDAGEPRRGANVAAKASASRVLHFKDAESWLTYQRQFGTGSLLDQTLGSLQRASRQEALLQRWGSNPREALDADIRYLKEKHFADSPDAVKLLDDREAGIRARFDMLDGTAQRPANRLAAQINDNARTIVSMAKLGLVAFTHLGVGVTKASELRYQGVGFLERHGNYLQGLLNVFRPRGPAAMREVSDLLLAGFEGAQGSLLSRFHPDDGVPGKLSKAANAFFKLSGLTNLVDAQKAAAEHLLSHALGRRVGESFDALPAETQRALLQYDISPAEWDVLRGAPDHPVVDGRVYLTPHAAMAADEAGVRGLLGDLVPTAEAIAGARDRLALKLHAYYGDVADRTVVRPGIDDRAIVLGGLRPGTPAGEGLRYLMQFKTWPLAAFRQMWGRELYGGQGVAGAVGGLMQIAGGGLVLGYLVDTLKDLMKGLNPRDPHDPRTWIQAMAQGGGLGVLGDFLFADYGRFGQDLGATVLGPVLGQGLTEGMNIWNDLKMAAFGSRSEARSAERNLAPETLRIITNNTPFVNMHAARFAWNYLFLHSLQESLNPGYLRRYERGLQQRTGQTYWLAPSQNHLHTFGR